MLDAEARLVALASLSEVKPEGIIDALENTSAIRGARQLGDGTSGQRWLLREHQGHVFSRAITRPARFDASAAHASFTHGSLTLSLPKFARQPPSIPVTEFTPKPAAIATAPVVDEIAELVALSDESLEAPLVILAK
jgi:HSP20 family molecular chaperone IbpA